MKNNFKMMIILVTLLASGCEKELNQEVIITPTPKQFQPKQLITGQEVTKTNANELVCPFYNDLDWESVSYIRIKYNSSIRDVFMFNHPSSRGYVPEDVRIDVKRDDGWRLVYNWFIPIDISDFETQFPAMLFYNIYRGKFKLFYYHMDTQYLNTNVCINLATIGKSTKIFNLNDLILNHDLSAFTNTVTQSIEKQFTTSDIGLRPNYWYAFEWDVSYYDPNLLLGDMMGFGAYTVKFSSLNLNKTIADDLNGKLTSTITTKDYNSIVGANDIKDFFKSENKTILVKYRKEFTKPFFQKLASSTVSWIRKGFQRLEEDASIIDLAKVIDNPIGVIAGTAASKLFGCLFPGKESTTTSIKSIEQKASLDIDISGSIQETVPFAWIKFSIPKTLLSPYSYCGRYGLFSLKRKVKVGVYEFAEDRGDDVFWYLVLNAKFDEDPANLIDVNPDLLNFANVEYSVKLVYIDENNTILSPNMEHLVKGSILSFEENPKYKFFLDLGNGCDIKFERPIKVIYGNEPILSTSKYPRMAPYKKVKILVNFKVTPKNGSAPVLINQLFEPEYVGHQVYDVVPRIPRGSTIVPIE